MEEENKNFIDSQLVYTEYYNDYKILEDMGFDKLMIKKVYLYINPKSLEDSINFMTEIENIYQYDFLKMKIINVIIVEKKKNIILIMKMKQK